MREPGDDGEGGYWRPRSEGEAHPLETCACPKPAGAYGRYGFHWNARGEMVERCPAYQAAVQRNTPTTTKRKRQ